MVKFWATVFFGWETLAVFPKRNSNIFFASTNVFNSSSIWNLFLRSVSFWPKSLLLGRWIRVKSSMAGLRFYQNSSKFPWNSKYFDNGSRKKSNYCKVVVKESQINGVNFFLKVAFEFLYPAIFVVKSYGAHMKSNAISKRFWLIVH